MTPKSFHASDYRWAAIVLLLVVLPWIIPNLNRRIASDSYQVGPTGKKLFYRLAEQLGWHDVTRNTTNIPVFLDQYAGYEVETVFLMLGPRRPPTASEWKQLREFVEQGGAFVYAAPMDETHLTVESFGVSFKEIYPKIDLASSPKSELIMDLGDDFKGSYSWVSFLEVDSDSATEVIGIHQVPQSVIVERGMGKAMFIATDHPFSNHTLTWSDNAVLAMRLVERLGERPYLVVDESLNRTGIPKIVLILLEPEVKYLSLFLLLLTITFCWWRSRRFGPVLPPALSKRTNAVTHTNALGSLFYSTRDVNAVLNMYYKQFRSELGYRSLTRPRDCHRLGPIANQNGMDLKELQKSLSIVQKESRNTHLKRGRAAALIRGLAEIWSRARSPIQ